RLGAIRLSGMLGNLHVSAGRPLAALEVHRRTLQMRTELLGEDHPGLAVDFNNVAAAAYTAGLEQVAVQSYRQAARMLAKDGKDGSAPMSVVQLGLARALHEAGQADAAAQHLQRALELARANFPP